ncbi:MAG: YnbE family lipoprotein [Nitrosomonadaceae bacterium]
MCRNYHINFVSVVAVLMLMTACTPTVKIEAPKEPITINLNIKLDADIYVKLEEQAKKDIESNPDLF